MTYIKEYWENKEWRAEKARLHTEKMEQEYSEEIRDSIANTIIYSADFKSTKKSPGYDTKIILNNYNSVGALFEEITYTDSIAVLNFASYKNPGGMFLNGSKAQEECLCHESFLYNVLKEFPAYYEWNNNHKNKALYLNRALFSPGVFFEDDEYSLAADVITCAAPNISTGRKYQNVSDEENTRVLKDRIRFVLDIAKENEVDSLVLGAYGCGVFGQDATEVATIFKNFLENEFKGYFVRVIFAIPDKNGENYKKFKEVFK